MINKKVEMLLSADSPSAISKSTGLGLIGFSDAFKELKPDWIIVLGDRFEILAASIAACFSRIPIVHIHGGEITQGAVDDVIRHSITKMAYLHFVAAKEYRKRVIQLGEDPDRVFFVGGMGVDYIESTDLLEKKELERRLGFEFGSRNLMITLHPVTLENDTSEDHFNELLVALKTLENTHFIFTAPNADTDGRIISKMIDGFVSGHPGNSIAFTSMGQLNYLSTLQFVDGVVGNSSSGLLEAPSFKIGTINIGDRQRGRIKAESIIDCHPDKKSIIDALHKLYSEEFQKLLKNVRNPYGEGRGSEQIVEVLRTFDYPNNLKKIFYDL